MGLTLITAPVAFPVTLTEAKAQCRVDGTDDDTALTMFIAAATDHAEQYTGTAIMAQTWKLSLDAFTDAIMLPLGPVQSVTSVKYFDVDGNEQTISSGDYTLDTASDPQWITRNSDASWPTVMDGINAVNITFVTGAAVVPPKTKQAILALIAAWHDDREAGIPAAVNMLLRNHRSYGF